MSKKHLTHISNSAHASINVLLQKLVDDGIPEHVPAPAVMLLVAAQAMDILGSALKVEVDNIMDEDEMDFADKVGAIHGMVREVEDTIGYMVSRLPTIRVVGDEMVYDPSGGDGTDPDPDPDTGDTGDTAANVVPFPTGRSH